MPEDGSPSNDNPTNGPDEGSLNMPTGADAEVSEEELEAQEQLDPEEARAELLSDVFFLLSDRANYEERLLSSGPLRQITQKSDDLYLEGWIRYICFQYASLLIWLLSEEGLEELAVDTRTKFTEKLADEHPEAEVVAHELETFVPENLGSFQSLLELLHALSDNELETRLEQEPTHPAVDLFFASEEMLPMPEKLRVHSTMVALSTFNKLVIDKVVQTNDPNELRPFDVIEEVDEQVKELMEDGSTGDGDEDGGG